MSELIKRPVRSERTAIGVDIVDADGLGLGSCRKRDRLTRAEHIALCINEYPRLLATVKELEEKCEKYEKALKQVEHIAGGAAVRTALLEAIRDLATTALAT